MRCIIYHGHIGKEGYGLDYDPETQKTVLAHRKVFKDVYGYLPKVVMHTCDNKACVNPYHLVGGTQSQNIRDCVSKGRFAHANRKLSMEQAEKIRQDNRSQREIAKEYGVDQKVVWGIKNGKSYISGKGGVCGV